MQAKTKEQAQELQQLLTHRVITMLNRKELDFLDKLGKDALFTSGHKLSHNEILRVLIDLAMEMGLNAENISSPQALKERLLQQIEMRLALKEKEKRP